MLNKRVDCPRNLSQKIMVWMNIFLSGGILNNASVKHVDTVGRRVIADKAIFFWFYNINLTSSFAATAIILIWLNVQMALCCALGVSYIGKYCIFFFTSIDVFLICMSL